MNRAFATPGSREAVLASFDASDWRALPLITWIQPVPPEEMASYAAQTGLALSYLWLANALFGHDLDFAVAVVKSVPQGSDTALVPRRWLTFVAETIVAESGDPQLASASAALLALYGRSEADETVAPNEWRATRNLFRRIEDEPARAAGSVLAAAAWDPVAISAAVSDVPLAWRDHVHRCVDVAIDWTDEKGEQLRQWRLATRHYAHEQAGPPGGEGEWFNSPEGVTWSQCFGKHMDDYRTTTPLTIPDRDLLARTAWERQLKTAQAAFLAETRALASAS